MLPELRARVAVFEVWLSNPPGAPTPKRMLLGPRVSSNRPVRYGSMFVMLMK